MADDAQTPVQEYLECIAAYDSEYKKWCARVDKLLKRYRCDNRGSAENTAASFNIFWSNVQTLIPAVYARMPKADVSRRFSDTDAVGRVTSLLIERCLDYEIEHYSDFRAAMHDCVTDRFLGGRGTSWVRYDPHVIQQTLEITDDVPEPQDHTSSDESEAPEEIEYECTPTDYVHWKDFGHSSARTWEEVTKVWRWVYLTKDAATDRFGKKVAKKLPFNTGPQKMAGSPKGEKITNNSARICELWDKEKGKVVWLSKDVVDLLDERDDPLELEQFFPCPKPLYATLTPDSLIPVPDIIFYQDQANELDILSDRIDGLVKALRVRGIYDASIPELQRLLTEGDNNTLIGTAHWSVFSEKGGLKGAIDLLPLDTIAAALMQAYQARSDIKAQVYEITGISDIVRGQTAASETATAQEIKGQYAGLRLKSMQEHVALFATDLLRIKAQIICSKYQDQTILAYAAADQLSVDDQQLIPQALQLLRKNPLRSFRVEVAADSLVQLDEQQQKQERLEFLGATANFMREALPAGQQSPEMVPALIAMLKFGITGFKQAKAIEGTLDTALQQLQQKAAATAANPPPNPELVKAQAKAQGDAQAAQMQAQVDAQMKQTELQAQAQLEQQKNQHQAAMAVMEQQHTERMEALKMRGEQSFAKWEAELKAGTSIQVALISAGANEGGKADQAKEAAQTSEQNITKSVGDGIQKIMDAVNASVDGHTQAMDQIGQLLKQSNGPKRIIRGPDGRATGVEPMTVQ